MNSLRRVLRCAAAVGLACGALTVLGAVPAGAANPVGFTILQGEGQCALASVDLVTGETTEIGGESADKCAFDLEFSNDGMTLLGTRIVNGDPDHAELVQFDGATGAVTKLSDLGDFPIGGPGSPQGNLTFSTAGQLYTYLVPLAELPAPGATAVDPACDGSAFCLFQVDQTDPTNLTYVNHVPQEITVYYGLATSCAGVTSSAWLPFEPTAAAGATWSAAQPNAAGDETLATVNLTSTGPATTDVGPVTGAFISSLDYNTAGTLYGVGFGADAPTPSLFTLNTSTGAATKVADLNQGGDPLNLGVLGFAIAHPCTAPPPPPTPAPTPAPAAIVTPRFTG
jgi:hypothetical protein